MTEKTYPPLTPPKPTYLNGRTIWDRGRTAMAEYTLWESADALSVTQLRMLLKQRFAFEVSQSYVGQILRELMDLGRVVKLARGWYVHAYHRVRVRESFPAPPQQWRQDPATGHWRQGAEPTKPPAVDDIFS